jgi:hypothetical protein
MSKLVRVIWIPLLLELCGNMLFNLIRDRFDPGLVVYLSLASILVTISLLLYLGWRVAAVYLVRPTLIASGLGLLLWFCSTILLTGGRSLIEVLHGTPGYSEPFLGPLVAFVLFAPAALLVPVLAVVARNRFRGQR